MMKILRSPGPVLTMLPLLLVASTSSVSAASLPIQIVANAWQAAAGNSSAAYILVHLSNPDGTPKLRAELLKSVDPSVGVELKNSKWSFETILIPPGFHGSGAQTVNPEIYFDPEGKRTAAAAALPGQLRIMNISGSQPGLYYFQVLPMFGLKGGKKQPLRWVSGQYVFRVSYRDGSDQGTGLGELVIR